jgi:hypothetical protein
MKAVFVDYNMVIRTVRSKRGLPSGLFEAIKTASFIVHK